MKLFSVINRKDGLSNKKRNLRKYSVAFFKALSKKTYLVDPVFECYGRYKFRSPSKANWQFSIQEHAAVCSKETYTRVLKETCIRETRDELN